VHHSIGLGVRHNNKAERGLIMNATATRTRIELKNVLFATDLSDAASAAIPYAKEIAKKYGAHLLVLHVRPPVVNPMTPPQTWANTEEAARLEAERRRKELAAVFAETDAEILIAEGDIQSVMESTIGQRKIDLVVIGTRGRSGFKKFFLGSVAEEIFREVSCPVLTVGPNAPLVVPQNGSPQRILYATDFNAESNLAASYTLSLAQEFQASLTLIHVVAPPGKGELVNAAQLENHFRTHLRSLVPPEAETWCKVEYVVRQGEVADTILEVAKERDADLIILGVRPETGFPGASTHLPIATAHKVVSHANCPVLTVRQ
jgi:nucleotide-binding universal stress UspA family protein